MHAETISTPDYSERIERMREQIISQSHEICIERAELVTESYKKTKGEPPTIRFAKAIAYVLENMQLKIREDEFLVGNRITKLVGTALFPEVRIDTIELDLEYYSTRDVQSFLISDNDKTILKEKIIPYWKNEEETVKSRFNSYLNPELNELMLMLLYIVDTDITNGVGHFFPGFGNVLKNGFDGLLSEVEKKENDFSNEEEKLRFLETVKILLNGAKTYIDRYSKLAKSMANQEEDPERRRELSDISEMCFNISKNAPKTFKEALQLIFFIHVISGIEDGGFAISLGRLDQILYPYYANDTKSGKLNNEKAKFLIKCFYLKLTTLWNYVLHKGIIAAEGPPIAENLTIGGVDLDGNDATNELSYLFLECYEELKTVQPAFSIRISPNTPEELLIETGRAVKKGVSIGLFNDSVMIPGLNKLGYSLSDAREYAPIGCVEPGHPYKSFGCTNATQFNIVKCLELTLNNGTDMFTRNKYGNKNSKKIETYEDLWDELTYQIRYFLGKMVKTMNYLEQTIAELNPQPFLSATISDCIERGLDVTKGGAIYDFTTTQLIGLATIADSLAVIRKIVFEEKLLSYDEMVQILAKNYRGHYREKKGEEWRQIFINKVPKFGNDNDYVDNIAKEVAKLFCDELLKYKNYRGGNYNPGIYSTSFHLAFGVFTAASADGRKSRDPLSNGVGPTNNRDKNGPTAILNSIMKLENELMTNGNSVTLNFHPNTIKLNTFVPMIKAFFKEKGGYHFQLNVVGKETLCDAQLNPNQYQGLVVRIAGYTVLFNELSKSAQDDIIARTQY
jgi:pyruvate formate-lyase/glycerol dehydratase family glycyl radical enzyme